MWNVMIRFLRVIERRFLLGLQSWHFRGIPRHRFVVEHFGYDIGAFSEKCVT